MSTASGVLGLLITVLDAGPAASAQAAEPVVSSEPSAYTSLAPVRVLDTRTGNGAGGSTAPVGPAATVVLDLAGRVPAGATAVVLNVTGTEPTAGTFVTAFPHGAARPLASNLNLVPGQTRPNLVTVAVGPDRKVDLYNNAGTVHLVADLAGYYSTTARLRFTPLDSERLLDTRWRNPPGQVKVGPGEVVELDLSRSVPVSAAAVSFNLTVTDPSAGTFITAYPHGAARPLASNANVAAGETVANLVTVAVGTGRKVNLFNNWGNVHLIADMAGFYSADYGSLFTAITPTRILDTRTGQGTADGQPSPIGSFTNIGIRPGEVVPDSAIAAVINLTGTNATAYTYVSAWQVTYTYPFTSTLNLGPGQTVPNLAVVPLQYENPYSRSALFNHAGQVDVIGDVAGYFTVPPTPCTAGCAYSWGNNYGRLGIGTTNSSTATPTPLSGLSGVTALYGQYALRSDGTVWAWGYNWSGELGNGWYRGESSVPVPVLGLSGATAIAGSSGNGYALRNDGTVWAWGSNSDGQLGGNGPWESASPVRVAGLAGITAIAPGYALRDDGTVWAWGSNTYGRLGNGSTAAHSAVPVQVTGLTGIVAIASGGWTGYAVGRDGSLWAWGFNGEGQLGNGSTAELSRVPVRVSNLTNVRAVGADPEHGFAVRSDGTAWGWGSSELGGLGNGVECPLGGNCAVRQPVRVGDLTGVVAVDGFGLGGYALRDDGTVWGWGYDQHGQLGPGAPYLATRPVRVGGLAGVNAIDGETGGHALVAQP